MNDKYYCQCGCGNESGLYARSQKSLGVIKGEPKKFLPGHSSRGRKWTKEARDKFMAFVKTRNYVGENNPKWRGGTIKRSDGRICVYAPDHPHAYLYGGKYILEYRLLAEKRIGRYLRDDEIVHHIDGNVLNNDPINLDVMTQSEHARFENIRRDKTTGRYCKKVSA